MDIEKGELIDQLEKFRQLIVKNFKSPTGTLRAQISKAIPTITDIVERAGTGKRVNIAPPPMIGGYQINNIDPFTLIFEAPYGMDMTQVIIDIIDQTLGMVESDNFTIKSEKKSSPMTNQQETTKIDLKKVFIVHGHDHALKESTARFLEKLQLKPIILHEQANRGKTIIEKFEFNSDVAFAIILLSPDDIARSVVEDPSIQHFRARQNVVFELGYFIGKLGREKVCAVLKGGIETPSDYDGIVYLQYDNADAWKLLLAKEMKEAGVQIDMNLVL